MNPGGAAPMPTIGGSTAGLTQDVNSLAPLAQTWSGANNGVAINQNVRTSTPTSGSNLSKFTGFLGGIADDTGHLASSAATWLARNVKTGVEAPIKLGEGISHGYMDRSDINTISTQNQQNSDRLDTLVEQYRSGQISSKAYQDSLKELTNDTTDLAKQSANLDNRVSLDQKTTTNALINTSSTLVTILTAGFGRANSIALSSGGLIDPGTKTASDFLASKAASAYLGDAEGALSKVISTPEAFQALDSGTQKVLQQATAEVVASDAAMTAGQISRAAITNVALKYPIYFNVLSSTGKQIYNELDQQKYGDAVRTVAFNAALLLSGGPIGHALSGAGGVVKGISNRVFGETSFWDELSGFYGDGSKNGFSQAVAKMASGMEDTERAEFIRNLSAVEQTNVQATGGDAAAAAYRVAKGMTTAQGQDLKALTHEQGLEDMVNWADAARTVDDKAQELGISGATVGRLDANSLNTISAALSPVVGDESRLDAWEALKDANPNEAWANNTGFDRQITSLIHKNESPAQLDEAIRGIQAGKNISSQFPQSLLNKIGKMGYMPIEPTNLEAPFKEGTGSLKTQFDNGADFFTKAVKPLPVLGFVGDTLTKMGLSPDASTVRVYDLFNQNLTKNLTDSKLITRLGFQGESGEQTADTLIKNLSDYAHDPTRGGIKLGSSGTAIRPPITDLRQLTSKDIGEALKEYSPSNAEIRDIKASVMDSMLQVPLDVRGLGDRLMDVNYKVNPIAGAYARVQGAARFAWNPVFAAKLDYKTEILSQVESGGQFPTLLGTNKILSTIMPEHYAQLDNIREALRSRGIFDEAGHLGVVGGEGVQDAGAISANLTHKLLPGQERSIAGLIADQAEKASMNVNDFIDNNPQEVRDTVQMITQYDRNANFLNSPMARTLNYAFFPFRFDIKVAGLIAKGIARTSNLTQFAIIHGLYSGTNWLKSDQGQAWYAKNADLIGLFKYFSPVAELSTVAAILGSGRDQVGSYGELGGLPFGWIPQLTDAAGLTHFGVSTPLINNTTGEIVPQYVPTNAMGGLQLAIEDLVGALFTYPGATVGLPSKAGIERSIAGGLTGSATSGNFTTKTPALNPEQQNYQRVIQQQNGTSQQTNPGVTQPMPMVQQTTGIPQIPTSATTPLSKGASGVKKKTKAEETPELLPGQTTLGQLP